MNGRGDRRGSAGHSITALPPRAQMAPGGGSAATSVSLAGEQAPHSPVALPSRGVSPISRRPGGLADGVGPLPPIVLGREAGANTPFGHFSGRHTRLRRPGRRGMAQSGRDFGSPSALAYRQRSLDRANWTPEPPGASARRQCARPGAHRPAPALSRAGPQSHGSGPRQPDGDRHRFDRLLHPR